MTNHTTHFLPPIFVIFYGYVSLLNDTIFWRGLGWVGLGWVGLGWVGLGWVREIDKKTLSHCEKVS
ncbi:hypothetical protein EY669_14190 [Enterococcus faecalis]|nr:hypothetical protein [Enterococcus faecalis]MBO6398787.1 hypothetical protein [Enterococcus faecalis]